MKYIHLSNGSYLGFVTNGYLFSRDGIYMGWVENDKSVWDKHGKYRGHLAEINGGTYILRHKFLISPIPRVPRVVPATPATPAPSANRVPIVVPLPYEDAFYNQSNF